MRASWTISAGPDTSIGRNLRRAEIFFFLRSRHRETVLVVALLIAGAALQLLLARYWIDLVDEGYFAEIADRVARGELPYRDFATPYTPALHYLHAWLFGVMGRDLVTLRLPLIVVKTGLAALVYLLGRRLLRPHFAALPVAFLIAIDTVPYMWEPHPAWYALAFALLAVWAVTRLIETGDDRWTLLAGVAAGLSLAFKQNIGLYVLFAIVAYLLFGFQGTAAGRARLRLPPLLASSHCWLLLRCGFAVTLLVAFVVLLKPYLDARLASYLLAPLVLLAGAGLRRAMQAEETSQQREAVAGRLVWLTGAWLASTLPWVLLLLVALGPDHFPITEFTGRLDLSGFFYALAEPRQAFVLLLLAVAVGPLALQRLAVGAPNPRRALEAAALLLLGVVAAHLAVADIALATPDEPLLDSSPWVLPVRAGETVLIYLPALAFWGGVAAFATSRGGLTAQEREIFSWFLVAGSLLLFNFFPRMDSMHVTYSAPLLFVVGAFALQRMLSALLRDAPPGRPGSALSGPLFASLLVLPCIAAAPNLEWRVRSAITRTHDAQGLEGVAYLPLGVSGAEVFVPRSTQESVGGVVAYLLERTRPGEPIFAYPTVPLFYYLADRPNPTRFGHLYPGAATVEEQGAIVAALEAQQVRYVVWDQFWVDEWGRDERFRLNQPLTDYLLAAYQTEAILGPFHILVRSK